MKKITRLVGLVLCIAMLAAGFCFVGCSDNGDSAGAYINMYLSNEVYNFDPAYAHLDSSAMKLIPLLYEGLMKLDEDGDVVEGLCEDWEYTEDLGVNQDDPSDDKYVMEIKIKTTAWSDGIALRADDFVYAWKRLLEPDFDGEGASLLYDVKGAIARKTEAASSYDIGLYADKQVLTIEFAHSINPEEFLRKLTSVALVPLREGTVSYYTHWSSAPTTILTNGPFTIRNYEPGQKLVLERSIYYMHDVNEDEEPVPNATVTPYRLVIDYTLNNEELMQKYEDGQLFFMSELPASTELRNKYKDKLEVSDSYAMCMYYFNTNKAPFNDPTVRRVLSEVIDREAIANAVVYAKAATGIVPSAVTDKSEDDSFAANNGNKLGTVAGDISAAKSALSAAGINPSDYGTLYLTVRADTESVLSSSGEVTVKGAKDNLDVMVANMVIEQWNKLGFDFEIKAVGATQYQENTSALVQYADDLVSAMYGTEYTIDKEDKVVTVEGRDFDVIAADYQMLDTTAFSMLSVYATKFSGAQISFESETLYQPLGHVTGYNSEAYNNLINEAYDAYRRGDMNAYSDKLHEAEAMLLNDMPVIPVFEYQNVILESSELSDLEYSAWGYTEFTEADLNNWEDFVPVEEAPAPEEDKKNNNKNNKK